MYVYTAHIKGQSQLTTVWVLFCTFHRSDLVSVFRLMLENVWGRRDRVQSVFDDVVNLLMVPLGFFFESPDWKIDILYLIGELSAILTKNEQCSQNDCNNEPQKADNGNHPGVIEYQNGIGLIAGVRDGVIHGTHHIINRQGSVDQTHDCEQNWSDSLDHAQDFVKSERSHSHYLLGTRQQLTGVGAPPYQGSFNLFFCCFEFDNIHLILYFNELGAELWVVDVKT